MIFLFNGYLNYLVCMVNSSCEFYLGLYKVAAMDCILSLPFYLSTLHCHLLSQLCILTLDSAFLHAWGFQGLVGSQISITEMGIESSLQNSLLYLLSKHRSYLRTGLKISPYMLTVHSLEQKYWTVLTPRSHVGKLLFLMSIIASFPLHMILLVVTEKDYFLTFS